MLLFAVPQAQATTVSITTTGAGTWTVPVNVTSVTVQVWGAGGAGGGNTTTSDGGGGGGGGGYSTSTVAVSGSVSYFVGAGGAGVQGGTGNGGGNTNFGAVAANGGAGGAPPVSGAGGIGGAGGAGSSFSGGNGGTGENAGTGDGAPGGSSAGTAANGTNGPTTWSTVTAAAAPAGGGKGGNGGTATNNGSAGSVTGGGGGGSGDKSGSGGTNRTGGAGAGGKIIITYQTNQTITFGSAPTVVVGGSGTVTATGGASGNPVTFTSLTTSICTVSGTNGSTVTGVAVGTCTIAANQAGDATNYNAAAQVTQNMTVGMGSQTITFGAAPTVVVGGTGTVSATGGASGNPVTFTSTTTGVCTVSGTNGSTVTGVAVGTCIIAANQLGNANYNAAPQVTQNVTVSPPFCSPPSNIPVGVSVSCQCDTFARATLQPSTIFNSNWIVSTSDTTGILPSIVNSGYLRLTNNTGNNAKAVTVPGIFPAAGNYISVEFQQYAYNGSGADGIAVTLSDYSVPAVPGAYGGSLGYAQETGIHDGFAGGWLGVALDEYGNYQNPTEGRLGGPGFIVQSVGARGSGSGQLGYRWLGGTSSLTPTIDDNTSTSRSLGYYYQVVVDARNDPASTAIAVNRDTGSGYAPLINIPNVYSAAIGQGFTQAPVPANWQISFTGSTGGSTNIHEISGLRICASTAWPPTGGTASGFSAIDEVYPTAANAIPAYQNFQTGHIFTKLPGAANTFKLWVAALTGTGLSSGYSTVSAKYAKVNLVDNSDNACGPDSARTCTSTCTNKAAVETGAAQTATFAVGGPGASLSPSFTLNSSWKNLVAVMKECTTSACTAFTATAPACSVDSFSVRPTGVSSVISSNATYAGIITGPPIVKAGSNFSLTAATIGVAGYPSGYTGNLKVNNATLQVIAPATVPGAVASTPPPVSFPAAASGTPSSSATGNFTYSEVGAFRLPGYDPATDTISPRGVFDGVATASECTAPGLTPAQCDVLRAATWTGVDGISSKGDCILDSYRNTRDTSGTFSTNTNYGKFGCNFGLTTTTAGFGRFVPDHFTLISAQTKQRNDIAAAYAATRETTGTVTAGSSTLTVADATNFSVGDTAVVFGAGTGGKDLITNITAAASNVLTLSATATTGVTNAPVFKRLGFTYMDEPLQLALSLEARNAAGGITKNYATATGLAKLDASSLTGTANNSWGLSGVVNNLYGVANCRAFFSGVAPYNTTYAGSCASLPASAPAAPYAAAVARVAPSNTSTVTWTLGATSLTTDITLKRASIPDGAFDFANGTFALGIWPRDGDGITFLNANDGASLLNAAKSLDIDAVPGADLVAVGVADMRLGRLKLQNAYGSERLSLQVPIEAQYWSGSYFLNNADDNNTPVSAPLARAPTGTVPDGAANLYFYAVTAKNLLLPADAVPTVKTMADVVTTKLSGGQAKLQFPVPNNHPGWLDIILQVPDYLKYNWGNCNHPQDTDSLMNDLPCARATFGTYKSPLIYRRENY